MRPRLNPIILTLSVMAIFAFQSAYFCLALPERMATHFGPTGLPNGWMTKDAFIVSFGVFLLFLTLMLCSTSLLLRVVPTEHINLPNREYWLAPDRKEATMRRLEGSISALALPTGFLMIAIVQLVFKANMMPDPHMGNAWWFLLAAYMVYMAVWTFGLFRRFQMPPG